MWPVHGWFETKLSVSRCFSPAENCTGHVCLFQAAINDRLERRQSVQYVSVFQVTRNTLLKQAAINKCLVFQVATSTCCIHNAGELISTGRKMRSRATEVKRNHLQTYQKVQLLWAPLTAQRVQKLTNSLWLESWLPQLGLKHHYKPFQVVK